MSKTKIPDKLFKYGSLDKTSFCENGKPKEPNDPQSKYERFLDIIKNNHIYAGIFSKMNDPMEGTYKSIEGNIQEDIKKELSKEKSINRFCSLSTSNKFVLMWAYYAEGHKGYCIEIDTNESHIEKKDLVKIKYNNDRPKYDPSKDEMAENFVRTLLSRKYTDWAHEDEWRYFVRHDTYWRQVKISKVYIGAGVLDKDFKNIEKDIKKINNSIEVVHMKKSDFFDEHIDTSNKLKCKNMTKKIKSLICK